MFFEHHIRRTWALRLTGALLLLIGFVVVLLSDKNGPSGADPRSTNATGAQRTNATLLTSTGIPFNPTTNTPGSMIGPGVTELAQLMADWQRQHPNCQMLVQTTGLDLTMSTEVFRFTREQGGVVHRVRTEMRKPVALTFITESEGNRTRAYFPEANEVVEIDRAEEMGPLPGQPTWSGGSLDATAMLGLVRASFVEAGPDYQALTMMLSGAALQLPQVAGDLFLTMRVDETGKMLSLEQLTLGMKVVSEFQYVDDQRAVIEEKSPKIPATAVETKKTFRQALEEQVEPKKTGSAKRITI